MKFKNLGPLLQEDRTTAICEVCNNFIYKQFYEKKTIFICKNCLNNEKKTREKLENSKKK